MGEEGKLREQTNKQTNKQTINKQRYEKRMYNGIFVRIFQIHSIYLSPSHGRLNFHEVNKVKNANIHTS